MLATILRATVTEGGSASIRSQPSTVMTQGATLLLQMAGLPRTSSSGANAKIETPGAREGAHLPGLVARRLRHGQCPELLAIFSVPPQKFLGEVGKIMLRTSMAKLG